MKLIAALAIPVTLLMAQTERTALHSVIAVRHWSVNDATRVAIEVTGDFKIRSDRLHNPERIYFDILDARPRIAGKRAYTEQVPDKLLKRLRVAETAPGITRVVLDLADSVEVTTSQLTNPNRLMIELRAGTGPPIPSTPPPAATPVSTPPVLRPPGVKPEVPKAEPPVPVKPLLAPPTRADAGDHMAAEPLKPLQKAASVDKPAVEKAVVEKDKPAVPAPTRNVARAAEPPAVSSPASSAGAPAAPAEVGRAARHTTAGETSLVRALGLKVSRVVIDPGHGGHDQGTEGPHGLLEKELVLDVSQRLGKLIEARMGAEVIYTRTDDTFIPLEGRTALANEKKADLFLSIHANSSPVPRIAGVEVFYLNFTDSKDALDVAARENASSQKSIFELRDIIQKITLHDKAEESRDFAGRVQTSLYSFSLRNFPNTRNRGVKKAPFVVLIGANMPSVLAEIGFLSNTREETLLKRSDYRQRLAEALYRGVARYAESLSHFQMASNGQ
jgi:N-acetylmuramoyl-L-alanine amidase